jgi:hypothetical protein
VGGLTEGMSQRFEISWVTYSTQRPEFANQSNYLYLERYSTAPNWHAVINGASVARNVTTVAGAFNQVNLAAFSNWHTSNSCNLYVNNITNEYIYIFDGTANSITDGGSDMYDGGNYISFSTTRGSTNLLNTQSNNYGTLSNITASNYGYFISQSNVWPQISLAYTNSGTIQWRISGGIGTDGGGSNSNVSGTYTTNNQGRNGSFWANQVFGTSDPSIVMTWFTIEQPNLNSVITSCNDNRRAISPPSDPMNQNFTVTGSNYLFGCFLLSSRNTSLLRGELIPASEIQNFLSNYVTNANIIIT